MTPSHLCRGGPHRGSAAVGSLQNCTEIRNYGAYRPVAGFLICRGDLWVVGGDWDAQFFEAVHKRGCAVYDWRGADRVIGRGDKRPAARDDHRERQGPALRPFRTRPPLAAVRPAGLGRTADAASLGL